MRMWYAVYGFVEPAAAVTTSVDGILRVYGIAAKKRRGLKVRKSRVSCVTGALCRSSAL